MLVDIEASEPKWVNPILNIFGVNSLRLEGSYSKILNRMRNIN